MAQKRKRVRTVKKVEPKKEGPVENTQKITVADTQKYTVTVKTVTPSALTIPVKVDPPAKPQYQIDHPDWKWDRKCTKCGGKTMMEAPKLYNIEVFECQNKKCRAQFTVETFYDRRGKFTHEEFKGMTLGPLS